MSTDYIELNTLTKDGRLYHDPVCGSVQALIPNTPFESCHASDLLELPNGDLLCCWFAGSDEGNADISIVLSRLNKGEKRWTEPVMISDDKTRSEQNPSLFLTPTGEIWAMYTAQRARTPQDKPGFNLQYTAEIRRKISTDNGHTWGTTETMFDRPGSFCRQKIQVLSSGRWVFGNWICFPDESRNGSDITVVYLSDDQGKTWHAVEMPESRGRVHANIIEQSPGKLLAFLRSRFADNVYVSRSGDDGETWSVPEKTILWNNNSSISAVKLQSGAIALISNPVGYNADTAKTVWPNQRCPVEFSITEDGGKTWPWRRVVEPGEGFTGAWNDINNRRYEYPVMMQGQDGKIHAAYSWGTRKNIKYVCVDEEWIRGEKQLLGAENNPDWLRRG